VVAEGARRRGPVGGGRRRPRGGVVVREGGGRRGGGARKGGGEHGASPSVSTTPPATWRRGGGRSTEPVRLESHKHVINIIMGFRDMGCYTDPLNGPVRSPFYPPLISDNKSF
jgi:hypothetical protein